ncbi:hypothetical protein ACVIHH_002061 [Bradyrhizobium sp. USDA 4518]
MIDPDNPPPRKTRDRSKDVDRSRLFTELSVTKLKLRAGEAAQITYRDKKERGLLLRLNISGAKSWCVSFYDPTLRKQRTEKLGDFAPGSPDHVSLKDARDKAANFRANRKTILADRAQNIARKSDSSFKVVSDWYVSEFVEGQRRSAGQIKAMIKAILPDWGEKQFVQITREDVVHLLDRIAKERGPRAADVTLAVISRMMKRYATKSPTGVRIGYVPVVVPGMAKIEDPSTRSRERTLSDNEIRLMFAACDRLGTFGALCKVLLYTGQRRTTVATMRFDDIEDGIWTVSEPEQAYGKEKGNIQYVRLPKAVLEIIDAQAEVRLNQFVFPASRVGRRDGPGENFGSYSAFGQGKHDLDVEMGKLAGIKVPALKTKEYEAFKSKPEYKKWSWTLHDLRRTTGTLMPRLGIDEDHRERVLGHKIGGVKGVYNRYKYFEERSAALQKVADLIETIVHPPAQGSNVVTIKRR